MSMPAGLHRRLCKLYHSRLSLHFKLRHSAPQARFLFHISSIPLLKCQLECPASTYGENCANKCTCKNDGQCDPVNGSCVCPPGWTGPTCEEGACPVNRYGPQCECTCTCNGTNTAALVNTYNHDARKALNF